jgi:NitT/TauT family transport system ATP-binding protein
VLTVSRLTKRFGPQPLFEELSLSVPRSGFTVLVGPSGCGKTTLFNVLTGTEPRCNGSVRWLQREVSDLGGCAAYMQQRDLLLPWMSLLENAALPAAIAGRPKHRRREKAADLFSRFGLAGADKLTPKQASGGMRQRCALVRTLMFERELVLLDEPLSALDAITRSGLQKELWRLQAEFSRTILMITHDVEEALLLADEVLLCSRPPLRFLESIVPPGSKPRRRDDPRIVAARDQILRRLEKEADLGGQTRPRRAGEPEHETG